MEIYKIYQKKLLYITGSIAVLVSLLLYAFYIYLLTQSHWTFYKNGVGDLILMSLFISILAFMSGIYYLAARYRLKWLHVPVVIIACLFIYITPRYLTKVEGIDRRKEQLIELIPQDVNKVIQSRKNESK